MIERLFHLSENNTTVRTELLAGLTTFLTMSYIIFVQPAVLSVDFAQNPTGLDPQAVLLATCLVSAFASIFMGIYARYPIALAPGMGISATMLSFCRRVSVSAGDWIESPTPEHRVTKA